MRHHSSMPPSADANPTYGTALTEPRLTFRLAELAKSLGISRRTLERERSAGRFPKPDLTIGKCPLWKPETIRRWIDSQTATSRKGGEA